MKKETSYLDIASKIIETNQDLQASEKEDNEIDYKKENIEINPELKELMEYANRINDIIKLYDSRIFIEPEGDEGRSYDEEFNIFFDKIKDRIDEDLDITDDEYFKICSNKDQKITDEEYSEMCPTFVYRNMDKIDNEKLEKTRNDLEDFEKEISSKCKSENVRKIIDELLLSSKAKINFYISLKNGNDDEAFEQVKILHGEAENSLCESANDVYKGKLKFFKDRPEKGELEKKLENTRFNAQNIRTVFELAIIEGGLSDGGYKVFIDKKVTNILVSTDRPGYDCPVVLIPPDADMNGLQLIRFVAHEIGRHVTTNIYNEKQGFSGAMGKGWDVVNEGISKRSETEVAKEILGEEFYDFEISAEPYYVLAMEKIRGEKNKNGEYENGWNYAKTFKYIYNLKLRETLYKNGYNILKERLNATDIDDEKEAIKKEIEEIKKESKIIAIRIAEGVCLRTLKGFDPREGGKYNPKDKIYLEGEIKMLELEKAKSVKEFEEYLRLSRVDPEFVVYLIKMGAYTYKKGLQIAKDIAKKLWKDEELPIKETMQGNERYELFLPYLSEFMKKYYKDEL
ncbi:MAG: DUF1704 domain-containing protein [Candidatus Pacebacteria bacterium]|nr:DUF1704 domain-containing protein [Candidatus Paceibacterota bacterium]